MWYFTWTLGLGLALAAGVLNVLWLELSYSFGEIDDSTVTERFAKYASARDMDHATNSEKGR